MKMWKLTLHDRPKDNANALARCYRLEKCLDSMAKTRVALSEAGE